jgi:ribosomal-protein-alanine N-acetyltransferase
VNEHGIRLTEGSTVVREWQESDVEPLAAQANDRRVWLGLRDAFPHPYGVEDARRFIAMARQKSPPTFFAVECAGRLAGGIGYTTRADVERIGAEVGYWLGPEFWGRGIATSALRLLTAQAFGSHRELRRLYALPYSSNAASARVLSKAGYQCEGTLRQSAIKEGRILDQWMYAILRDEWVALQTREGRPGRAGTTPVAKIPNT